MNENIELEKKVYSNNYIKCPHCGAQYLPGEIFMTPEIVGIPRNVIKDSFGKILYTEYLKGDGPDCQETYTCDYCNKPFIINADVNYNTTVEEPEKDFSDTTVSLF